jgi:hypothetical protein
VIGGPGRDSINGDGEYSGTTLGGNDTIQARDGETDQVACGFGADTAVLDASDVLDLVGDCESVDQQAAGGGAGGGGGGGSTPGSTALTVALSKPKPVGLRALARGKALAVSATLSQPCAATLKLTVRRAEARRAKLGRKAVTLASTVKAAIDVGDRPVRARETVVIGVVATAQRDGGLQPEAALTAVDE